MDIYSVWRLGWNLVVFQNRSKESLKITDIKESFASLKIIVIDLEKLSISPETINELKELISDYKKVISQALEYSDKNEDINDEMGKKLEEYVSKVKKNHDLWTDRIEIELKKVKVKKLYTNTLINPEKLQNGASSFFSHKKWGNMDDLAKRDLEDGCECILVEAWTPAAMIIIRSIESGLRIYYKEKTKNDPSGKTWGELLKELKANQSSDKSILAYFDYLRGFRNRLQHPDARFTQSETEDVLAQSIHVFNRIYA